MKKKKAFTLIELMVAMGIIAVLITMSIFGITIVQRSLRNTARRDTLESIKLALEAHYNDYGSYPTTTEFRITPTAVTINGNVIADLTGAAKASATTTNSNSTRYCYIPQSGSYQLAVDLEANEWGLQLGDPALADCQTAYPVN